MGRNDDKDEVVVFPDESRTVVADIGVKPEGAPAKGKMAETVSFAGSSEEEATRAVDLSSLEDRTQPLKGSGTPEGDEEEALEKTVLLQAPLAPPKPEARLLVQAGNDKGREFVIGEGPVMVGRGLDMTVVLNDLSVSRRHFQIRWTPEGKWTIRDIGSANGTKVNGVLIRDEIPIEDGAVIEAGQTVLVFYTSSDKTRVVTAPPVEKDMEATVITEAPQISEISLKPPPRLEVEEARKGRLPFVPIIIASVLVVGLALVVAHFAFGLFGSSRPKGPTPEEEARKEALEKAKALVAKGQEALRNRKFEAAIEAFEEATSLDPQVPGGEEGLARAQEEARNEKILAQAKAKVEAGEYGQALDLLKRVPETSVFHEEAETLLKEARGRRINSEIEGIKALLASRKKEEAKEAYLALLEREPEDERVLAFRKELEAAGVRFEASKGQVLWAVESSKAPQGQSRKGGMNLGRAFELYDSGDFDGAVAYLREMASKAKKADAARAQDLASTIEQFASAFREGSKNLKDKRLDQAEQNLLKAMRLDKQVDGHYEGTIKASLGETYRFKAAQAVTQTNYVMAASYARKALAYNPNDSVAKEILGRCVQRAEKMFARAQEALKDGNKDEARALLKDVIDIVQEGELANRAASLMNQAR